MTDRYSGLVELYDLPELITTIKNGELQEPEYTGEYINRIGEELRQANRVTNNQIAEMLKRLFDGGYVDQSYICTRLLEDEPQPFQSTP